MKYHLSIMLLLSAASLMAQSYFVKGPANPKPYEATAIKDMQDYLAKRIGGNKLVIGGKTPVTFQIGDTELAKEQKCLSTELEDERWVIRSVGDQILVNGGGTRGALYATYHFLEDFCDIHWWSDYEEYVPATSSLTLKALDATGKPVFLYRDIYRTSMGPNAEKTAIRVRLNRNGGEGLALLPIEVGGSFAYGNPGHCHTFDSYVPFEKYGKDHPEYFSLRGGKRVGGQYAGQLCLTNPDLKQMFLSQLLNFIENDKAVAAQRGLIPPRIYDVSMNDNWNKCECDKCKAEEDKYNPSGHYLNFVNWIAAEVAKKHSGIYISTLAYFYTEPPPKGGVRAADNVIVKLCDTKTNQSASILEKENKIFYDFLTSWKGFAKNLFIWDYAITFTGGVTGYPFASEFHYGDLYRTYHENNVTGVFWEHECPHCADFYELKFFLETKLFEDPYQDVNKLISLFMDRYYGAAAPLILQYRRTLDTVRKKNGGLINWFPSAGAFSYIRDTDIMKCQGLFDAAEKAVANDSVRFARVRHARVGLDRLTCYRSNPLIYHGKNKKKPGISKKVIDAAYNRVATTRADWVKNWQDNEGILKQFESELAAMNVVIDELPPPKELKGRTFYDFYPQHFQSHDGALVKLIDDAESPTGKAMRTDVDPNKMKYYDLPFIIGVYDQKNAKGVTSKTFAKPIGKGYNWYKLDGIVHMPKDGYVYLTRSWTTQLRTANVELAEHDFEIWASVKFTGPKFFDGSKDKNYIYIDRIVLIEPNKQEEKK
ncbi:MAG: DUF4838 domain-containing protein [Victivallales bacterium]|nr:DUF4838 domain-containing protein [Victivallales bacterium]